VSQAAGGRHLLFVQRNTVEIAEITEITEITE
jgi:hypothetical protein